MEHLERIVSKTGGDVAEALGRGLEHLEEQLLKVCALLDNRLRNIEHGLERRTIDDDAPGQ